MEMRRNCHGLTINIASIADNNGFPVLGYCDAIKFAANGLSETLRGEVEALDLKVMVVEPSTFRADWAGRSAD